MEKAALMPVVANAHAQHSLAEVSALTCSAEFAAGT
eukprot:CAMPEP_0171242728 /NCGR_PEP_ID=MMETSP0790-20130122/45874_1 /TAXON_ID=2925 /ORGANISM="Alexandrium catenella, Strain OF101" /LENGTH=35 /DNA_ID= /DNA_START= /DNA_END= /DNA_ORIENTATION=